MTNPRQSLRQGYQLGFTLIEVLVVMILLALIGGVLFQALERAYNLQQRFGTTLFSVQQGQMASDWFRQSVQGLYPDYAKGAHVFQGGPREFSGLSTSSLNADYGTPTHVTWKLHTDTASNTIELSYQDTGEPTTILHWVGKQAQFIYFDDQQQAHDTWPPSLGLTTQLPSQIQIQTPNSDEIFTLVASPMGPVTAPLRLRDIASVL